MNFKEIIESNHEWFIAMFEFETDRGDTLSHPKINVVSETFAQVSTSVDTYLLNYNELQYCEIEIDGSIIKVLYAPTYKNSRFIIVDKYEDRKNILKFFEKEHKEKLISEFK